MRLSKDEALKRIEARSPELCKATKVVLLAFPGSKLAQVSRTSSCIQAPEGHYLAIVGPVTATVESPKPIRFGWSRPNRVTVDRIGSSDTLPTKAPMHGLDRKDLMAANGYTKEIE